MNANNDLPQYESEEENVISYSPYYRGLENSMPDATPVSKGGFYLRDDSGSIVYQLKNYQTADAPPLTGTINVRENIGVKMASVNGNQNLSAISHEAPPTKDPTLVTLVDGFIITNLVDVTKDLPATSFDSNQERIQVRMEVGTETSYAYLYNVTSKNGQLSVIHAVPPGLMFSGTETITMLHGMVFVQYKESIYIGYLQNNTIMIDSAEG